MEEPEEERVYEFPAGARGFFVKHGASDPGSLVVVEGGGQHLSCDDVEAKMALLRAGADAAAKRKRGSGREAGDLVASAQAGVEEALALTAEAMELGAVAEATLPKVEWRRGSGADSLTPAGLTCRTSQTGQTPESPTAPTPTQVLHVVPWRWALLLACLALANLVWTGANALEVASRPLAAIVAACAFTGLVMGIGGLAPGRKRKGRGREE